MAASATAGWLSAVIDDHGAGTVNALDYEISINLPMANTAPASPQTVSVYIVRGSYISAAWVFDDGGTTTLPTSAEGAYTIGATNDFIGPVQLNYTAQNQTINATLLLSQFGFRFPPDGFSIFILDNTGAAIGASPVVQYRPIQVQNV